MIEIKAVCTLEEYEQQKEKVLLEKQDVEDSVKEEKDSVVAEDDSEEEPDLDKQRINYNPEYHEFPVRCIETQEEYECIHDAANKLNIRPQEILNSAKNHGFCRDVHFVFASEKDYIIGIPDLPGEIWYDIPGYEGHYQVSNKHRVKSLARRTSRWAKSLGDRTRAVPEYLMNTDDRIPLYVDGIRKFYKLSELERMSFPGKHRLFKFDN